MIITSSLADLRPGDIMFGPIGNDYPRVLPQGLRFIPGRFPIAFGQTLLAPAEMRRTPELWWNVRHVAVVTEAQLVTDIGTERSPLTWPVHGPRIVQAMPSGAEEIEIGQEHWTSEYAYVRPAYATRDLGSITGSEWQQANAVAAAAEDYIGTPYSFMDYAALALHRLRAKSYQPISQRSRLDRYVASSKRMICSQLADQAMSDAGWHNFDDGRLPQDVMPAELFVKLLSMPGQHIRPGQGTWMRNNLWPVCCSS